jgi:hypothetical protein
MIVHGAALWHAPGVGPLARAWIVAFTYDNPKNLPIASVLMLFVLWRR